MNNAEDLFNPSLLVGCRILWEWMDKSVRPVLVSVVSIKKHYKGRDFHKNRCDLVAYEINTGSDLCLSYE